MIDISTTASKYFKHVQIRDDLVPGEYFFDSKFTVEYWTIIEWIRGDFFLDEYFRGLAEYSNEIWLYTEDDKFAYWCEGAHHRPKKLDTANWTDIKDNVQAIANMASNVMDGGLSIISDGEFERIEIIVPWDDGFEPEKVVKWVEEKKALFKGWRDGGRFRPVYTFKGWGIDAWVKSQ